MGRAGVAARCVGTPESGGESLVGAMALLNRSRGRRSTNLIAVIIPPGLQRLQRGSGLDSAPHLLGQHAGAGDDRAAPQPLLPAPCIRHDSAGLQHERRARRDVER